MSAQFLTHDRLAAIAHSHSGKSARQSAQAVLNEVNLDRDDYRSFIVERRAPMTQNSEKILANWLVQRKSQLASV